MTQVSIITTFKIDKRILRIIIDIIHYNTQRASSSIFHHPNIKPSHTRIKETDQILKRLERSQRHATCLAPLSRFDFKDSNFILLFNLMH